MHDCSAWVANTGPLKRFQAGEDALGGGSEGGNPASEILARRDYGSAELARDLRAQRGAAPPASVSRLPPCHALGRQRRSLARLRRCLVSVIPG